jgi:acetoin utilization deacetylase AcuC-like enzyme
LVCSFHQNDLYPFSGTPGETGEGQGLGYTVNVPVFSQYGDTEYTFLTGHVLQALVEQYMPQIILVSAGFDGHKEESISKTQLSTRWYATATTILRNLADETCNGRLLMVLEGGYNAYCLQQSVLAVLDALAQENGRRVGIPHSQRASALLSDHPAGQFWTF